MVDRSLDEAAYLQFSTCPIVCEVCDVYTHTHLLLDSSTDSLIMYFVYLLFEKFSKTPIYRWPIYGWAFVADSVCLHFHNNFIRCSIRSSGGAIQCMPHIESK